MQFENASLKNSIKHISIHIHVNTCELDGIHKSSDDLTNYSGGFEGDQIK